MGRSEADIRKLCPGATVQKGLAIRGSNVKNAEDDIVINENDQKNKLAEIEAQKKVLDAINKRKSEVE